LAEASQAGAQPDAAVGGQANPAGATRATDSRDRGNNSVDGASRTTADKTSAAGAAAAARTRLLAAAQLDPSNLGASQPGATLRPALKPGPADADGAAPEPMDGAHGGKTAGKSAAGAGADSLAGSLPLTDPAALAALIAASGMQVGGSAAAGSVSDGAAHAATDAADGKPSNIAATGAATNPSANAPASALARAASSAAGSSPGADLLALTAPAQPSPTRPDAAAALDAKVAGGLFDAAVPVLAKSANPDSPTGSPSALAGAAGLPDLARSMAASPSVVQGAIAVPVSDPHWPHALAAQVHWFVNNDVQSATLRVSPEHLGPIEVHIDVRASLVDVSFNATHAETRAALEQSVPRLRELFASSGLTLGHANVQQDPRSASQSAAPPLRSAFASAQSVEPVAVGAVHLLGLIDEYV
jgi:flagellar hook-length control protein FliK